MRNNKIPCSYCDCFAAGIYCAGPCSCQGCFNRPEYEETVLETRQLIESRNPLAFAPKIVPPKNKILVCIHILYQKSKITNLPQPKMVKELNWVFADALYFPYTCYPHTYNSLRYIFSLSILNNLQCPFISIYKLL